MLVFSILAAGLATPSAARAADFGAACEGIDNSYRCAKVIEALQLPSTSDRIRREGDTLSVRLDSNAWVEFPAPDRFDPKMLLTECDERARKCVLFKQMYESIAYVVVDLATGRRDTYPARVQFSPDAVHFAVGGVLDAWGSPLLEIRDTATDRTVLALGKSELNALAKRDLDCAIAEDYPFMIQGSAGRIHWLQEDALEFELTCSNSAVPPGPWVKRTYEIHKSEAGWLQPSLVRSVP